MLFITMHETGNTNRGANARAHGNYLRGNDAANLPVSWHYTVDDTVTVQHLPETEDAFHAGDGAGSGNRQSIGIEICVNSDGDFQRAIDRAAVLVADICTRRNIPMENIRQHFDWSRKNCPQNIRVGRPHSWSVFLDKVKAAMTPAEPAPPAHAPSNWARDSWAWAVENKLTDGTNPQNPATREQMMQLFFNYHKRFHTDDDK
jgi:N-acetylmuramoyl-L-alanine amidase